MTTLLRYALYLPMHIGTLPASVALGHGPNENPNLSPPSWTCSFYTCDTPSPCGTFMLHGRPYAFRTGSVVNEDRLVQRSFQRLPRLKQLLGRDLFLPNLPGLDTNIVNLFL